MSIKYKSALELYIDIDVITTAAYYEKTKHPNAKIKGSHTHTFLFKLLFHLSNHSNSDSLMNHQPIHQNDEKHTQKKTKLKLLLCK